MSPISKTTFKDWQKEQLKNPEFAAIARELEPGYQIARLRIARGLTQTQLAEMARVNPPSRASKAEKVCPVCYFWNVSQAYSMPAWKSAFYRCKDFMALLDQVYATTGI